MAVEIKQIVIRAVLTEEAHSSMASESSGTAQEGLVQECVDQVLKILKKKNRR